MKYVNKNKGIIRRMNWGPYGIPKWRTSRTHFIKNQLSEALHIFNKDNTEYNNAIKEAIIKCKLLFNNDINIIKFDNKKYTKTNINYSIGSLKEITLYIHYTDKNIIVCKNIAYPEAVKDYVDTENPTYVEHIEIIKDPYKDHNKEIRIIDKVSILCDINTNASLLECYSAIRHEFIHILHELEKSVINMRAGNAYYYAEKICQFYNLNFPEKHILLKINQNNPSTYDFIQIFCGCLYYLDTSEYSAWLDSYYTQLTEYIKLELCDYATILNKGLYFPDAYQIVNCLYSMLKRYNKKIIQIANKYCAFFIKEYFADIEYPEIKIKQLVNHYTRRSETFLKKCEQIFHNKTDKYLEYVEI